MNPVLFRLPEFLGGIPVPAYGAFLLMGVIFASLLFAWLAGLAGAPRGKAFEVTLEMVLVGMLAAKVAGVLLLPPGTRWTAEVVAGSGGVWYFGFLAGLAYLSWRRRVLGLTWLDALDRMLPAAALGHAFGRIGCFLAGCCWGRECDLPWAVSFPAQTEGARTGIPTGVGLHPTQLYEAGAEILLSAALVAWLLSKPRFIGLVTLVYLPAYALVRFVVEMFRADYRGALGTFSTSQIIALLILAVSLPALVLAWRRGGLGRLSEPAPPPAGPPRSRRGTR